MHPSRILGAALILAGSLSAPLASADDLSGTRFDIEERADRVELRLDRGVAKLVVQRVVANGGPRSDQATFHLDLPDGAVATRLRTAGLDAKGHPIWFEGDLMDAEEAAAKYKELTGIGGYYPKDPALLSWRHRGLLALQVFPVPARATKTVEYTLLMPMRYADGKYVLELPRLGTSELPATVRIALAHDEDKILVNGVPLAEGFPVEASRSLSIELQPGSGPRLEAALATVPLGEKRVFVHARAAAARHLGEVPAHAAVAIVLDMSKSMKNQTAAEVAAARAYLASFKDAEVTVVTFDRKVTLPFGAALPVSVALARLQAFVPEPHNGSQVDDAVARADAILSRSSSPVRRMVVLTDLLTRETLTPEHFSALSLKSGAIVHLATVAASATSLARDDESPWAVLPRTTGGVFWHAGADTVDAAARDTFEEWARPKRLDSLRVRGFPEGFSVPDVLVEGQGLEYLGIAESRPAELVVEGLLWSTPARIAVTSTADEERRWSALVFGSAESDGLSEDEQRVLAMKGRAVSPVTSYLAIEPGVRPSTDGLDRVEGIGEGGGGVGEGVGMGNIGMIGHGYGGASVDPQRFLESELGRAWRACGGIGHAEMKLESTVDEVVDVARPAVAVPSGHAAECLVKAAWALDLPGTFTGLHETWTVGVEG